MGCGRLSVGIIFGDFECVFAVRQIESAKIFGSRIRLCQDFVCVLEKTDIKPSRSGRTLGGRKSPNRSFGCRVFFTVADIDRISKGIPVPGRDSNPWIELKSVCLFLAAR